MAQTGIDFSAYIAERTRDFTGREWVFAAIDAWLADPDAPPVFLLTGNPGSGKTAIAARLVQFSTRTAPPPGPFDQLSPDFLSAIHFCSARDRRWTNPHTFTASLALQLAARYPPFAQALAEHSGDRQIQIQVEQRADSVSGQMAGVVIHRLEVGALPAEDAFVRTVREPLEALLGQSPGERLVLLVDALDEALLYSGGVGIVELLAGTRHLTGQVRFILTSRREEAVENRFLDAAGLFLSAGEYAGAGQEDVQRYVARRLDGDQRLAAQAAALIGEQREAAMAAIVDGAEGNFLYATFLLAEVAQGQRSLGETGGLPQGLDGLYYDSLARVVRPEGPAWTASYAPLLGLLSVAQGSLTPGQLVAFTGLPETDVWEGLGRLQQFVQEEAPAGSDAAYEPAYRLYHQSVVDFLRRSFLVRNGRRLRNGYHLSAEPWHQQIADHYWQVHHPDWRGCDAYGLDSLATHLYLGGQVDRLHELISKNWMMARHETGEYAGFVDDVDLAWQAAMAQDEPDPLLLARLGTARRSVGEDTKLYGDVELKTLVWLNRTRKALNLARLRSAPLGKSKGLLAIYTAMQASNQADPRVLNEAYEVVRGLQGGGDFRELVAALANAGRYNAALECADYIKDDWEKAATLYAVSAALARTGDHDRAQEIACTIQSDSEKAAALCEVTAALAQAGKYDRAQTVACTISNDVQRTTALVHLASALIRAGLEDKALETLRETPALTDAEDRVAIQIDLSPVLGGEDEREAIALVGRTVQEHWWEVEYVEWLSELAAALDATGGKRGSRLFEGARQVADSIADEWEQRPAALHALAEHLARAGRFGEAVEIACSVKPDSDRMITLRHVFEALDPTDTELSGRLCTEALKCSVSSSNDSQYYEALCELVVNMPPGCRDQARNRLRMELETARSLQDKLQRQQALSYLVAALAYTGDDEAKDIFGEVLETRRAEKRASVGVRDRRRALVKVLADSKHLAEAEDLARLIWDTNNRSIALLTVAVPLVLAGDPHGEELFSEVEQSINKYESSGEDKPRRPGWPSRGRMARYANLLRAELLLARLEIMILDGRYGAAEEMIGAIEEVDKSMRSYWRGVKAQRQYAVALAKAGHARAESAIGRAIATARRYYELREELDPLCQLAIDLAQAGDPRARVALDEAAQLYRRSRHSLDRAEVRRAYAVCLAYLGDPKASRAFEQARKAIRAIPDHLAELRAELLCKLAADIAQSGGDGADRLFEEAGQTVDALGESARRPDLLSRLASIQARAGRLPGAFNTLEPRQPVDRFVEDLAKWAPFFEREEPGRSLAVLREATSVAGWLWPSWREIHGVLPTSQHDG